MDNIKCQEKKNEEVINIKEYQKKEKERYFQETKERIKYNIKKHIKDNPYDNDMIIANFSYDSFYPLDNIDIYNGVKRNFTRLADELEKEGILLRVVNHYRTLTKGIIFKREVKEFIGEAYELSW